MLEFIKWLIELVTGIIMILILYPIMKVINIIGGAEISAANIIKTFIAIIYIILPYFICSFSMSHLIAKRKGINLKEHGSKNYGASNTLMLVGKKEALIVLISDIAKGFISVILCSLLVSTTSIFKNNIILIISALAILGHIFPFYLKFKGGKGFATYIGVVLAFWCTIGLGENILLFALIMALITDYIVIGTLTLVSMFTIMFLTLEPIHSIPLLIVSIIIWVKHFENIKNIKNGTEPKMSEKLGYNKKLVRCLSILVLLAMIIIRTLQVL